MAKSADICMVIEGSYPYVTGGVSEWIHWLLKNLNSEFLDSGLRFALVALVAEDKGQCERKYQLPKNVVQYMEFNLFDFSEIEHARPIRFSHSKWQEIEMFLYQLMAQWENRNVSKELLLFLRDLIQKHGPSLFRFFLENEKAFEVLTRIYENRRPNEGFLNYFYNFRNIHFVVFRLLTIIPHLPKAKVYHSPGTGYAGWISCLRALMFGGKSIITEHTSYVREREIDILKSSELKDQYLKDMWTDFFKSICSWQYRACDRIICLYNAHQKQIAAHGIPENQIDVIPNGIDVKRFSEGRAIRCMKNDKIVGFVGRVARIKNIKAFIETISIVTRYNDHVQALIIGPMDEEPDYYHECVELVNILGLQDKITFTGKVNVVGYYKILDVLLLTSNKEAMPLVIMEAMACAIPVVATRTGACEDLIYGYQDGIGHAGIVVGVTDIQAMADAVTKILTNPELANTFGKNGMMRIERFYKDALIIDHYKRIYEETLNVRDQSAI